MHKALTKKAKVNSTKSQTSPPTTTTRKPTRTTTKRQLKRKITQLTVSSHSNTTTRRSFSTNTPTDDKTEKKPTPKELRAQARGGKQQPTEAELMATVDAPTTTTSYAVSHSVYSNTRAQDFANLKSKYPNFDPYPDCIQSTMTIGDFAKKYSHLENGSRLKEEGGITVNGRIFTKRQASSKLTFLDIASQDQNFRKEPLQVICSAFNMDEESLDVSKIMKKGDWVSITGFPGKTDTGELSIVATKSTLLSPSLQYPPTALIDPNRRFRQRHLDLFVNRDALMEIFRIRTGIFRELRNYLNNTGFVEVETPILWTQAGGATARPFMTNSNAFGEDMPLALRIAPELFLKQLVIGGIERVYEIGKVFRNEGIDATHSPEFTSCELYQAHANYHTMMDFTEDLLRTIVKNISGKMTVRVMPPGIDRIDTPKEFNALNSPVDAQANDAAIAAGVKVIDFSQPFKRLDIIQTLAEHGIVLPENYNDDESLPALREICHKRGWTLKAPFTVARCLDTMISEVIEPMCIQPTFIMNHPVALSPLAKRSKANPMLTERFELFINTKEYANAYTELNIPSEQLDRFTQQQRLQLSLKASEAAVAAAEATTPTLDEAQGQDTTQTTQSTPAPPTQSSMSDFIDDEAHPVDLPYCQSLQTALPPLGGWGLGIDRLVMLISQQANIRDVLFFPITRTQGQ